MPNKHSQKYNDNIFSIAFEPFSALHFKLTFKTIRGSIIFNCNSCRLPCGGSSGLYLCNIPISPHISGVCFKKIKNIPGNNIIPPLTKLMHLHLNCWPAGLSSTFHSSSVSSPATGNVKNLKCVNCSFNRRLVHFLFFFPPSSVPAQGCFNVLDRIQSICIRKSKTMFVLE